MRRAAVLGKPIGHSLSPVLHNAGYAAAGLTDWSYTAIECAEAELADLVGQLDPVWVGLSLTMPLKEVALVVADEVAPRAAAIGAANTLLRLPGGGWRADNTDAPGMVDALQAAGVAQIASIAVLGAGGTARAAVAAAGVLGVRDVRVYARRPAAVDEMRCAAEILGVTLEYGPWDIGRRLRVCRSGRVDGAERRRRRAAAGVATRDRAVRRDLRPVADAARGRGATVPA